MGHRKTRIKVVRAKEAAFLFACALALGMVFDAFDSFERFADFAVAYEAWQIDEMALVLLFLGLGFLGLAFRRAHELANEIDRREAAETNAHVLARHDALTGLANRRVLQEALPAAIAEATVAHRQTAVLMIDLDGFKPVNDAYGHDAGDAVLVEVAERLQRVCGPQRMVARVGGDEFVVLLGNIPGAEPAGRIATSILQALAEPILFGGHRLEIGATIGIARAPSDTSRADELLRLADVAMYEAKRDGKGTHRFFRAEMDERLRARAALASELRCAIELGEVLPYFQPVMSLADNRVVGFEALARWEHPVRGIIGPDVFIPIAEENGLIDALMARILRDGCIAARAWNSDTSLSINISPLQLRDDWLAVRIATILAETGFAPERLIVEVTENAVIEDIDQAARVLAAMRKTGIRIALDDFGKGYSSLGHLRHLKFNHLKIDSSFVQSMGSDESRKIVSAVAGLGRALGMPVTAEGVETAEIADALRAIGCEQAQGYLFGRPGPAATAPPLLTRRRGDANRRAAQ